MSRSSTTATRTLAAVQVRMDDPSYNTVAEEDYATLVDRCHKNTAAFIIDDGRDEDWTNTAFPTKTRVQFTSKIQLNQTTIHACI